MTFTATDKLGDIVARLPKAGEIFRQHEIDFCCHGDRLVGEVAKEQNINQGALLTQLNDLFDTMAAANSKEMDWVHEPYSRLIEHVVNRYHAYLQTHMPELSALTTKILRVHGMNHGELMTVHRLFHTLKMEFEEHMMKEEQLVFPKIVEYEKTGSPEMLDAAVAALDELEKEHDRTGELIRELHKVTSGYQVPDDGCSTYRFTYMQLEELESDTFVHVHLENNILFPRLRNEKDDHDDEDEACSVKPLRDAQ